MPKLVDVERHGWHLVRIRGAKAKEAEVEMHDGGGCVWDDASGDARGAVRGGGGVRGPAIKSGGHCTRTGVGAWAAAVDHAHGRRGPMNGGDGCFVGSASLGGDATWTTRGRRHGRGGRRRHRERGRGNTHCTLIE